MSRIDAIELNMAPCCAVSHPHDWEWVGYREIMVRRQRYRLIDLDRLCWRIGSHSPEELRRNIEHGLKEKIIRRQFLERTQAMIFTRLETRIEESTEGICVLHEKQIPYNHKRLQKNGPKAKMMRSQD